MKKIHWLALLALTPSVAYAWPWSTDMMNQPSLKPQEGTPKVFPKRSEPIRGTTVRVADRDAADKMPNPVPATPQSVKLGGQLFGIYCTPCHGDFGRGDGKVGAKLILKPFDLTSAERMPTISDGYIFGMMTFGGAVMPMYANDLSATERWHVVNYVRHGLPKPKVAEAVQSTTEAKKEK
jgi:mono/diheme cytochrome c family protein